jgi:hypothetical protein
MRRLVDHRNDDQRDRSRQHDLSQSDCDAGAFAAAKDLRQTAKHEPPQRQHDHTGDAHLHQIDARMGNLLVSRHIRRLGAGRFADPGTSMSGPDPLHHASSGKMTVDS